MCENEKKKERKITIPQYEVEVWEMNAGEVTAVRIDASVYKKVATGNREMTEEEMVSRAERCMEEADEIQEKKTRAFGATIGINDTNAQSIRKLLEKEARPYKRKKKKHRKLRVKGTQIRDTTANEVKKIYNTPITKERYFAVLKAIAQSNGATQEVIQQRTGFSGNSITAHLQYGIRMHEIRIKNAVFFLRKNAETRVATLKEALGAKAKSAEQPQDTVRQNVEKGETKKTFKNGMTGTPITNKDALHIHMTYHVPILAEPFRKILNIVGNAPNHRITAEQVAGATGYSINASLAHLRYGVRIGEFATFILGDKKNQFFCLKSKLNEAKPKKKERFTNYGFLEDVVQSRG